jgi:CheY-like chemotaxis protein
VKRFGAAAGAKRKHLMVQSFVLDVTEEAYPVFCEPIRFAVGVAFLATLVTCAPAQDKQPPPDKQPAQKEKPKEPPPKPKDPYSEFFKKPTTIDEYWDAIQYELKAGKYDLAAEHLHGLVGLKPTGEDLAKIESDAGGARALLRLRSVPKWSDDTKIDKQARKEAEDLLFILGQYHTDPARIDTFIRNLGGEGEEHTPEERAYALRELQKAGAAAVPPLIEVIRATKGLERQRYVTTLSKLPKEAGPPLVAALDIPDNSLRLDLIGVALQRADTSVVPSLWHLAAAPSHSEGVREAASKALAAILQVPYDKLPAAKIALTREADRHYNHQAFGDAPVVAVWRWDGKALVRGWAGAPTVPVSKAEEYYGLKYARQALDLDPAYEPAQVIFLSLALDKADAPTPEGKVPNLHKLLATVNPELVTAVLERALTDRRPGVILGAIKGLTDLAEARANRPRTQGQPALVRALYYPERRVQMAAAEALIRIPGPNPPLAGPRVVEVLRRAAAAEPSEKDAPKVLVGYFNAEMGQEVAKAVEKAGMQPVRVNTGREALLRLGEAADIDAILIDANLPDPGLSSLLAQLRADVNVGDLPLVLAAPKERVESLRKLAEKYRNVSVIPGPQALDPDTLKRVLLDSRPEGAKPLSDTERRQQTEVALRLLSGLARNEPPGYEVQPAIDALLNGLKVPKLADQTTAGIIEAVAHLDGPKPQRELAAFVLDPNHSTVHRTAAAGEMVRHIQKHGLALLPTQISALESLARDEKADAALRGKVLLIEGTLRPDPRATGDRLKDYNPPDPGGATPKEPPKDKEPKDK